MSSILKGLNESYSRDEENQQNAMNARRSSDLNRERNAGLNEPDEFSSEPIQTRNGVYEYNVPAGQEKIAKDLGLDSFKGHWFSRVPVQRADFQFGRPQFHAIPSKNVSEAEQDFGPDYQDKVNRLGQMAKQGERKTVWDPVKRVYKTVPVNPLKEQGVAEEQLDELSCWSGYHRVAGTKAGFPGSCAKNKTNESEHSESCPHCGGEMVSEELMNEKKDACYYKVKSRYKVWPSAYASGALVKCRKKGADSWGNGGKKNEGVAEGSKENNDVKLTYSQSTPNHLYIDATIDGSEAGGAAFKKIDGVWTGDMVYVQPYCRRQGVATKMYDYAEDLVGKITPSNNLKPKGKKFWANRIKQGVAEGYDDEDDEAPYHTRILDQKTKKVIAVDGPYEFEDQAVDRAEAYRAWAKTKGMNIVAQVYQPAYGKDYVTWQVPEGDYDLKEQGVAEEHLDEKWTKKYKDSINCSNPKGFSQKAHCAGKQKNESSILEGINRVEESLHDWFNKEKWVRMDTKGKIKGPCAREPGEGKPKCLPQAKAHSLGKKGRASAAQRKRREDPNPDRTGKAINVNTKKQSNENIDEDWKKKLGAAALAGSMALGAAGASADTRRVTPDGQGGFTGGMKPSATVVAPDNTPSATPPTASSDTSDPFKGLARAERADRQAQTITVGGKEYRMVEISPTDIRPRSGRQIVVPQAVLGERSIGNYMGILTGNTVFVISK